MSERIQLISLSLSLSPRVDANWHPHNRNYRRLSAGGGLQLGTFVPAWPEVVLPSLFPSRAAMVRAVYGRCCCFDVYKNRWLRARSRGEFKKGHYGISASFFILAHLRAGEMLIIYRLAGRAAVALLTADCAVTVAVNFRRTGWLCFGTQILEFNGIVAINNTIEPRRKRKDTAFFRYSICRVQHIFLLSFVLFVECEQQSAFDITDRIFLWNWML